MYIILILSANLWSVLGYLPFMNWEPEAQEEKLCPPFKDLLLPSSKWLMLPATDTAKQLVVRALGKVGPQNSSQIPWDLLASVLKADSPFPVRVSYAFNSSSEIGITWVRWHFRSSYEHSSAEQFLGTVFCGSALDMSQCVALLRASESPGDLTKRTLIQRRWGLDFPAFPKRFPGMLILVNREHTDCPGRKWGLPRGLSASALYPNTLKWRVCVRGFEERPVRSASLTSWSRWAVTLTKRCFANLPHHWNHLLVTIRRLPGSWRFRFKDKVFLLLTLTAAQSSAQGDAAFCPESQQWRGVVSLCAG